MSQLSKKHRKALEEYAALKISLDQLRESLRGVLEFDFQDKERRLTSHYGTPDPGVRVELKHIRDAMDKHASGEVSTEQLADWATMLLLNDAYRWDDKDEDEIAELLHEISSLTLKPTRRAEQGES
jgi:hypothetical protein